MKFTSEIKLLSTNGKSILLVVLGFVIIFYLSIFAVIATNQYLFAAILFYILASIFIVQSRNSIKYYLLIPIPSLGLWMISITFLSSFEFPIFYASIIVSMFSILLPVFCHFFSRKRSFVGRIPMASISRSAIGTFSLFFFMFAIIILSPSTLEFDVFTKSMYFGTLSVAYLTSIMTYVNSSFRYLLLCRKIGSNNVEKEVETIFSKIKKRFTNNKKGTDLLTYYLKNALISFEEGDYENSFLSAYKIIREPTLVNPTKYVNDLRDGSPSKFSEIRTILMHTSRRDYDIDVNVIKTTKKKLPIYSLEMIERVIELFQKIINDVN
jgi:hypothetical protein